MLATRPIFIKGDNLTFKQYFQANFTNKRLLYSSCRIWWKKTTLFCGIPLALASLILIIILLAQELYMEGDIHWSLVFSIGSLPLLFMLPLIWIGSFYYSFVTSYRITHTLEQFIHEYFPDATKIKRYRHNNYSVLWRNIELEVAYAHIPWERGVNHSPFTNFIFVCMYYNPKPENQNEILDEDGKLKEQFISDWKAYCGGKESCQRISLDTHIMSLILPIKDIGTREEVVRSLEQMRYLFDRFNLSLFYLGISVESRITAWLNLIDTPAPSEIIALNVGIFETASGYLLYMIGTNSYDANNDDWACNEQFASDEKYFEISRSYLEDMDEEEFQDVVKNVLEVYTEDKMQNPSSLFYNKIITLGFDEGTLVRIR